MNHPTTGQAHSNAHTQTLPNTNTSGHSQPNNAQQPSKYVALPYVQGLSEKLTGILKPFDIKPVFRSLNDLSACFRSKKDPIPQFDNVNVVYKIPCTGCDSSYIGTMKRPLKLRLKEHTTDVYTNHLTNGRHLLHTLGTKITNSISKIPKLLKGLTIIRKECY